MEMGQRATAQAVVADASGRSLSGWEVQWSSSDTTVATIDKASGLVTAVSAGNVTINGTGGGHAGSADLRVTWPGPGTDLSGRISAGQLHTCALDARGYAYCWGLNNRGQLGNNSTVGTPTPVRVETGLQFQMISAGSVHTCAIATGNQRVYCWGFTASGRIGNGVSDRTNATTPQEVSDESGYQFIDVGGSHTCGITLSNQVKCWGPNDYGQLGTAETGQCDIGPNCASIPVAAQSTEKFSNVAVGRFHTCAVTTGGQVYCWGDNEDGELGAASLTSGGCPAFGSGSSLCSMVPLKVGLPQEEMFTKVVAGLDHTCALARSGRLYCWGGNNLGQIGDGSTTDRSAPVMVMASAGQVDAGGYQTCALAGGPLYCWGDNSAGQLGDGGTTSMSSPERITLQLPVRVVALGQTHTCSVNVSPDLADGGIYCWGLNNNGQLGAASTEICGTRACSTHPLRIEFGTGAIPSSLRSQRVLGDSGHDGGEALKKL
jgi:alpha-tubulin suppressor-like RCC1 family protein